MNRKGRIILIIRPADIMIILGCCERSAQQIHRNARLHFKKERHQYVTVEEFADYSGISAESIRYLLGGTGPDSEAELN